MGRTQKQVVNRTDRKTTHTSTMLLSLASGYFGSTSQTLLLKPETNKEKEEKNEDLQLVSSAQNFSHRHIYSSASYTTSSKIYDIQLQITTEKTQLREVETSRKGRYRHILFWKNSDQGITPIDLQFNKSGTPQGSSIQNTHSVFESATDQHSNNNSLVDLFIIHGHNWNMNIDSNVSKLHHIITMAMLYVFSSSILLYTLGYYTMNAFLYAYIKYLFYKKV